MQHFRSEVNGLFCIVIIPDFLSGKYLRYIKYKEFLISVIDL